MSLGKGQRKTYRKEQPSIMFPGEEIWKDTEVSCEWMQHFISKEKSAGQYSLFVQMATILTPWVSPKWTTPTDVYLSEG